MTDTNTTPTPQEPKDVANDLLQNILAVLVKHIDARVESKVNAIFESHATLTLISDATEFRLKEMVTEMIEEHEADYDHPTNDDVSDLVATHINHYNFEDQVKRSVEEIMSDGDYATEERVQEMVQDYVDNEVDYAEKVKEGLRGICD